MADTLNELGNVASLRNDYVDAQARFERVADIYRAIYGDHHYLVAEYEALGNAQQAKRFRQELAANEAGPPAAR